MALLSPPLQDIRIRRQQVPKIQPYLRPRAHSFAWAALQALEYLIQPRRVQIRGLPSGLRFFGQASAQTHDLHGAQDQSDFRLGVAAFQVQDPLAPGAQ